MKRVIVIIIALSCMCASAQAQSMLERLGQRAKNAMENKIGEKVEEAINNGIDVVTGNKQKDKSQTENSQPVETAPQTQTVPVSAAPAQDGWTCPDCGRTGNTGALCEDCGAKNPEGGAVTAPAKNRRVEFVKK